MTSDPKKKINSEVEYNPEMALRMHGIDSIGFEAGFKVENQKDAFDLARAEGLWIQAHVAERWLDEPIESALKRLLTSSKEGLIP